MLFTDPNFTVLKRQQKNNCWTKTLLFPTSTVFDIFRMVEGLKQSLIIEYNKISFETISPFCTQIQLQLDQVKRKRASNKKSFGFVFHIMFCSNKCFIYLYIYSIFVAFEFSLFFSFFHLFSFFSFLKLLFYCYELFII